MNGGELSGSDAVNLVFRGLDYQRTTKGADSFIYDFNNQIIRKHLSYDEQAQILHTLSRQGRISLRVERAENGLFDPLGELQTTPEIYIVGVEDADWLPIVASASSYRDTHLARLNFRDGALSLSVDGGEYQLIAKLTDGAEPYKIFEVLFNHSPGVVIRNIDIFPSRGSKYNLKQVITKSNIGYLLSFIDESVLPRKIARKEDVTISEKDLQSLLSKINESYRSNFLS